MAGENGNGTDACAPSWITPPACREDQTDRTLAIPPMTGVAQDDPFDEDEEEDEELEEEKR